MNNDKKEINQGGHIWLDQCSVCPSLTSPFSSNQSSPLTTQSRSGYWIFRREREDRPEWVIRSVNVALIHYQVRIQHNFVTLVTPAAANIALALQTLQLFYCFSPLNILRVWCIINSSLKCEGCDGMQEKGGHWTLWAGWCSKTCPFRDDGVVVVVVVVKPNSSTTAWPGVMNSEWVHVVEREGQCVASWPQLPLPLIRNQGYFCSAWSWLSPLFICWCGDSEIMELSDTFMIFCIRELFVMSNWINYWILIEWSTF